MTRSVSVEVFGVVLNCFEIDFCLSGFALSVGGRRVRMILDLIPASPSVIWFAPIVALSLGQCSFQT